MKLKLVIRDELNMRKGKISAQLSHAVLGMFLSLSIKENNEYKFSKKNTVLLKEWLKNPELDIIKVKSENELLNYPEKAKIIRDAGLTEFGQPTYTCSCVYPLEAELCINSDNVFYPETELKQVLIANQDLNLDKYTLPKYTTIACVKSLETYMEEINEEIVLKASKDLQTWLSGRFKKITLKANTMEIENLIDKLNKENIKFSIINFENKIAAIGIEPKKEEEINKITGQLKLY